jgi:hypothetical protein
MQSKFCSIDDWETADLAATGITAAMDTCCPGLSVAFSIFMSDEAGTPASKPEAERTAAKAQSSATGKDNDGFRKKSGGKHPGLAAPQPRNVFDYLDPPKPSFASGDAGWPQS